MTDPKFKVYYKEFDSEGNEINSGIDDREYINYGSAVNRARKLYGDRNRFKYEVAWRDPWGEYTVPSTCKCCGKSYERPVTHMEIDRSNYYSLIDRSKPGEYFHGYICPDCYEKIKRFINSLSESEVQFDNDDLKTLIYPRKNVMFVSREVYEFFKNNNEDITVEAVNEPPLKLVVKRSKKRCMNHR